jgi:hypothetical protein
MTGVRPGPPRGTAPTFAEYNRCGREIDGIAAYTKPLDGEGG